MERLRDTFVQGRVILDLQASDIGPAIRQAVQRMVSQGILQEPLGDQVTEALVRREQEAPTAIGRAIAVPHAYLEGISEPIVFFVRLDHPINLGAPDGVATRYLFFLLGPPGVAAEHLDTLASVARMMSDDEFRYQLGEARTVEDLIAALDNFTRRTAPKPSVATKVSDGLKYTGKIAGGLRGDITRRLQHYVQDFRDGLHPKCVGSTLFLFFACLAPAVTFGGVMANLTGNQIGAVENLLATAICGVVYALFSGQPLNILGATGPLLIFTATLYGLCTDLGVPFLPTYTWVGLWAMGFLLLAVVADAGCLMRYFTRFTDEIFSGLISLIFIYEAIRSLLKIVQDLDVQQHHDTALLSLLLALGTFYVAMSLSRFRSSSYLRPKIREFLADFGPTIALAAMTGVSIWLHEVDLKVLPAPDSFGTTSGRPWTVNLFDAPQWVWLAAAGPALLLAVLLYLDQNITARIVNSPDHKLHKGEAYHLDLGVVAVLVGFCSLFGLPWLVAATVRSLNHVRSLATIEDVVGPHGDTRQQVVHVRENRLTGLSIHLLVGFSLLLLPLLKTIPMAVLYGLFLYMGLVSMKGNQFIERLSLWLKDPALYPITHYIRRVPIWTIHAFTLVQLVCLAVLWFVKSSAVGILFPVFIALLVPIRLLAGYWFAEEHLAALDAEEEPEEEETHWAA